MTKVPPIRILLRFSYLCWVLLVIVFWTGCSSRGLGDRRTGEPAPPTVAPSVSPARTVTPMPRPASSIEPTEATASPAPSRTPLPSLTPTVAPSSTPAATPFPTLLPNELNERVLTLLQTNAGCQLPCWWGVSPGKTNWAETRQILGSLGLTAERYSDRNVTNYSTRLRLAGSDIEILEVYYVEEHGTVWLIWVASVTVRDRGRAYYEPAFVDAWRAYSPSSLVANLGEPTEVLVDIVQNTSHGGMMPFQVLLFYADQGVLVRYYGPAEPAGDRLRVCLVGAHTELWLWSIDNPLTLSELAKAGPALPADFLGGFVPFEQIMDQSFGDFAVQTRSSGACFESPADLWP